MLRSDKLLINPYCNTVKYATYINILYIGEIKGGHVVKLHLITSSETCIDTKTLT